MDLYADGPTQFIGDESWTFPRLNQAARRSLNHMPTEKEIESAIFQMGPFKAAGPDGFPPVFYQRNWETVKDSVCSFVVEAFRRKHFPSEMNLALVSLIPKVQNPESITQFRPIALTNVITKIISKVIANRLKGVVAKIVSPTQAAFTPGRQAAENIIIAQELVHTMKHKSGKKGIMVVKVDLEKAYDRVSWPFMRRVLERVGFSASMVDLMMFMISSARTSIIWNGQRLKPFKPSRGIRQGDPAAPYLFLLCMDVLSQLICRSVTEHRWRPVKASRHGPAISHIFFADDLLLFGEATVQQAAEMDAILAEFCKMSGQRISLKKSMVYTSHNTEAAVVKALSSKLQMGPTDNLGSYLGMPILHSRVSPSTYNFLLSNMRSKLASWKTKVLSQAARAILIRSVLATLPAYVMQTAMIPMSVIREMERYLRDFFWDELDGNKHLHYISWDKICQPKKCGGLGIRRLHQMNVALLAKFGWKALTEEEPLWIKVLLAKYGSPLEDSVKQNASATWRSIRGGVHAFRDHIDVGQESHMIGRTKVPMVRWHFDSDSRFSVASMYRLQTATTWENESRSWHRIWRMKGPLRDSMFLWRARGDMLPTMSFLIRRRISSGTCCGVCGRNGQDRLHDLRDCDWAARAWRKVVPPDKWGVFCSANMMDVWVDANLAKNFGSGGSTLG